MITNGPWPPVPLDQNFVNTVADKFWHYCREHFPSYDYWREDQQELCQYSRNDNISGLMQRAFEIYWALRGVHGGGVGLGIGTSTSIPPFCIGIDKYNGSHPNPDYLEYGYSTMEALGEKLPFFDRQFDVVTSLHSFEHMENPVETLVEWLRVLRPNDHGSYIAIVCPDNDCDEVLHMDADHKWAPDESVLMDIASDAIRIAGARNITTNTKVLYCNTLQDGFCIDLVLQRRD